MEGPLSLAEDTDVELCKRHRLPKNLVNIYNYYEKVDVYNASENATPVTYLKKKHDIGNEVRDGLMVCCAILRIYGSSPHFHIYLHTAPLGYTLINS